MGMPAKTIAENDCLLQSSMPARRNVLSVPIADPDIVGAGIALPGLHQRLQAHQKNRPLGAAVVHEFRRFSPTLMIEQDDGIVVFLFEIETDLCSDPFCGPLNHLPGDALAGLQLETLHVEAADLLAIAAEAELEQAADFALPLRIGGPPGRRPFTRGQCLVNLI